VTIPRASRVKSQVWVDEAPRSTGNHRQPPILKGIAELIPRLPDTGVTHDGVEIASDQPVKIDQFIQTRTGLNDIEICPQIGCPDCRKLLKALSSLSPPKNSSPIAMDLLKSKNTVVTNG